MAGPLHLLQWLSQTNHHCPALCAGAIIYDLAVVGYSGCDATFRAEGASELEPSAGGLWQPGGTPSYHQLPGRAGLLLLFQDTTMIMIGMVSFASGALYLGFCEGHTCSTLTRLCICGEAGQGTLLMP